MPENRLSTWAVPVEAYETADGSVEPPLFVVEIVVEPGGGRRVGEVRTDQELSG